MLSRRGVVIAAFAILGLVGVCLAAPVAAALAFVVELMRGW